MKRNFPFHGVVGIVIIAAAEFVLFKNNRVVKMYFTPIAWTGYILFIDALIARIEGSSPLSSRRIEFFISLPLSIICWYVFEGVNLLLKNWEYINLPQNTAARWLGYVWSYATIFPAIFITAELLNSFLNTRLSNLKPINLSVRTEKIFFLSGLVLFVIPLVFPSPYLCPLPWVSVLLLLEGINHHLGIGSFSEMFRHGDYSLFVSLIISGGICGLLWEFWNFWALTKWQYHVPYLPEVKLFEMPVLGFLGFLPFALECYLMYRFTRFLVPASSKKDILNRGWKTPLT
jgi:hypothetical protein